MGLYLGSNRVRLRSVSSIPYTIVGSLTISYGVVSGFGNTTNYLTLDTFNPSTNKWKFTTKIKFNSLSANMSLIDRNSSTRCFQISMRTTGKWRVNISNDGSTKANEVDGTHTLFTNTIYYLSFEYTGTQYILKYSTDNINWTTDITINNSSPVYSGASMCMGHSWYNSGTEKWDGDIYLRSTHLDIGEKTYNQDTWKLHCLENKTYVLNATIVGSPIISEDFIVSNLDNNNYLSFNLVNPNKKAWEVRFKFKLRDVPISGKNANMIISSSSDQNARKGLIVYVNHMDYSTPTLGMNIQTEPAGTWGYTILNFTNIHYTVADEWWWMKVGWTGTEYYMSKSLDGENFDTQTISNSYNQTVFTQNIENIGASGLISQGTNLVIVDMKEFKELIEGVVVWEGVSTIVQ